MAQQYLDEQGLSRYDSNLKKIVGGNLNLEGLTLNLVSVSGEVIGTVTIPQKEYALATASKDGLLSASGFSKLEGVQSGATKVEDSSTNGNIKINGVESTVYAHPSGKQANSGLYKIATDANGHVTAVTAVAKSDITGLGIPSENTTYDVASASANGLMSSSDFSKLGGISSGAQVNVIEKVSVNGTALTINSKGVNIDLSNYALKSDIASAVNFKGSVNSYSALPSNPAKGDMYNVVNADATNGIKAGDNVVWDGSKWDNFGGVFEISAIPLTEIDALFE